MEYIENSKSVKKCDFYCNFCNSKFALKKTLDVHLKSSKKCIATRPKIDVKCIWCKGTFITNDDLQKHYKKCEVDKNTLYISLTEENKTKDIILKQKEKEMERILKEKEQEVERLNSIIKDLTNKIKGDTTTNNNTINNKVTYNITLNCAKPLLLSKERIIKIMDRTCVPYYIRNGQEGLADWFLNEVCRNDNSEIAIECTDKNRKKFRYEDENDTPKEISGVKLTDLLRECIPSFKKSLYFQQATQEGADNILNHGHANTNENIKDFEKPGSKFINYIVDKTHVESENCLLKKKVS